MSDKITDLPPELIAQLSVVPELVPTDFTCAICQREATNCWNWSPKDYERAPVCKSCERGHTGWPFRRGVQPPKHGSFRDRREAVRIFALADALHDEAARMDWNKTHAA